MQAVHFSAMTLKDYLERQSLSEKAFAATVGADQSTIHRVKTGALVPRPDLMKRIVEATQGDVTPNDLYGVTA